MMWRDAIGCRRHAKNKTHTAAVHRNNYLVLVIAVAGVLDRSDGGVELHHLNDSHLLGESRRASLPTAYTFTCIVDCTVGCAPFVTEDACWFV